MPSIEQRLTTIERLLRDVLRKVPEDQPKMLPEKEVMLKYNLSASRLKQLRLGYKLRGEWHDAVLLKWTKLNGRQVHYDVEELEAVLKRK